MGYSSVQWVDSGVSEVGAIGLSFTSTPAQGDLLLCLVYDTTSSTQPTVSDTLNGNWTFLKSESRSSTETIYLFGIIAAASQPILFTATQSGDTLWTSGFEFSGNAPSIGSIVDNTQIAGTTGSPATNSSVTPPSVTSVNPGDLIFSVIAASGTSGSSSPTWTQNFSLLSTNPGGATNLLWAGYLVPGAAGTYSPYTSWPTTRSWVQITAAFLPATNGFFPFVI